MPLYTLINPTDQEIDVPYGTFPPFSVNSAIELNNAQARNAVQQHGAVLLDDGADDRTLARAAFAVIASLLPGLDTHSAREVYRAKAGQQEWRDLLRALA